MLHTLNDRNLAIPSFLAVLLLCGTFAGVTAAPVRATTFDWSQVTWNPGDLSHTYTLADSTVVTFTVTTAANGSFGTSPYKDGPPAPLGPMNQLGTLLDLGILFDPNLNQGMSPVIITMTLSPARSGVSFEISDVDTSGSGATLRIDQVVVACDGAAPSSLTAKTVTPVFSISGGNTATADGVHSVDGTSDDGTAVVHCGPGSVSTVKITYNETSGVFDPPERGIGVFGALQFNSPQADLAITKTDGVTNAIPGQPVTYTITASNAGPNPAPGSTVVDTFPAACTSVAWTCTGAGGGTCTASGVGNLNDTVNLPVGGSVTYSATCAISATATGSLTNTATVAPPAAIHDPTPGNNSATDTDTLVTGAVVGGTKSASGAPFAVGSTVTYTVVLTNSGSSPQGDNPGPEFTDMLPTQLTLLSASASSGTAVATIGTNTVTWNGAIPVGGSVTITITATILAGAAGSTITNQGWIFYDSNGDNINDKMVPTDDPVVVGANNPTVFLVPSQPVTDIPTLSDLGLLALGLTLLLAGMSVLRRKRA